MIKLAVFTGAGLRHKRLLVELETRFQGEIEILWVVSKGLKSNSIKNGEHRNLSAGKKPSRGGLSLTGFFRKIKTLGIKKSFQLSYFSFLDRILNKVMFIFHSLMINRAEKYYFKYCFSVPVKCVDKVVTSNPNSKDIETIISSFAPDLFISFGGPIYKKHIYGKAKYSINQHAGLSPLYKGSYTTEQALLKSDYENVGVTIHHLSDQADEGAIIKTGKLALGELDSPARIFVRNCALGTDLICDVVGEYIKNRVICGTLQLEGRTFTSKDMTGGHVALLYLSYYLGVTRVQMRNFNNEN